MNKAYKVGIVIYVVQYQTYRIAFFLAKSSAPFVHAFVWGRLAGQFLVHVIQFKPRNQYPSPYDKSYDQEERKDPRKKILGSNQDVGIYRFATKTNENK